MAFRINAPGHQNVKEPVLLRHDLALQGITLQVALVSPETGNVYNPRFIYVFTDAASFQTDSIFRIGHL